MIRMQRELKQSETGRIMKEIVIRMLRHKISDDTRKAVRRLSNIIKDRRLEGEDYVMLLRGEFMKVI